MMLEYKKDTIKNLAIGANKREQYELDKTLELDKFITMMIEDAKTGNENFHGNNTLYKGAYPRTIRVAPSASEMCDAALSVNNDLAKIDVSDLGTEEKINEKNTLLRSVIKPKQIITINEPGEIWWGDTRKAINGRIGLVNNDRSKSYPFKIGGTQSHVCAGGNTGQGKSVMMDAFIMSLLTEYPSWELSLFLIDMKMLEHAKYAQANKCPQIRDIGITGSATYITSVLVFVEAEMKRMYNLATTCGTNSLTGLRDALDLCIPATLVVADEFSQFKENATNKEMTIVDFCLQSIAKLGRSMRYHLLPTSQTFKGAITADTHGQFSVGMAVGSNDDNSENIIGNVGAVLLKQKVGYCIVNQNRKTKSFADNIEYKVAFVDPEKEKGMVVFQDMLKRVCDYSKSLGIEETPTVFNERTQKDHTSITSDMENLGKKPKPDNIFSRITLGSATAYSGSRDPKVEYIDMCLERNSNIFIHSMRNEDIRYLTKLVSKSIQKTLDSSKMKMKIKMVVDNREAYLKGAHKNYKEDLTGVFATEAILGAVTTRETFLRFNYFSQSNNAEPSFVEYLKYIRNSNKDSKLRSIEVEMIDKLSEDDIIDIDEHYKDPSIVCENKDLDIILNNDKLSNEIIKLYTLYERFMEDKPVENKYFSADNFPKNLIYMFEPQLNDGVSNGYGIKDDFVTLLKKGPSVGIFFIIVMKEPKGQQAVIKVCKHILTGSISPALEALGTVTFSDESGINYKYTESEGDERNNKYFKKYLYINDDFFNE